MSQSGMAAQQPPPLAEGTWRGSPLPSGDSLSLADPNALDSDQSSSRKSTLTAPPTTSPDSDHEMIDTPIALHGPQSDAAQSTLTPLSPTVSSSPLYRIPPELRRAIFAHLLSSPLGINFPSASLDRALAPQLLRTNRVVHREAAALLYGANKLIFSHPSDANVFRHALADPVAAAQHTSCLILRVKNADARLWTAYFNSLAPERSLVRDFPALREVYVRFRGPRYLPHFGMEQNAVNWLRDPRLVEIVPAVRKCVEVVMVEVCVRVPDEWDNRAWEAVVERLAREEGPEGVEVRRNGAYIALMGVWVKLETEGT